MPKAAGSSRRGEFIETRRVESPGRVHRDLIETRRVEFIETLSRHSPAKQATENRNS